MNLFVFGFGYTSEACVRRLRPMLERCAVTTRSAEKAARIESDHGLEALVFDGQTRNAAIVERLATSDALIVSVPPDADRDPVLAVHGGDLKTVRKILYFSTIGVYGDFGGAWVDEATEPTAASDRARRRLLAENAWLEFGRANGIAVHILRLAGIYGPGRNALCDLANGTARRLHKRDQVFNRIHVDDIALVAEPALRSDVASSVWNVTDDEPAPPQDVVAHAAELLGVPVPPLVDFESVELSEMAKAFYSENKRVANRAIRERLGVALRYPTYREGLAGLLAAGEGRNGSASRRQKDRPKAAG